MEDMLAYIGQTWELLEREDLLQVRNSNIYANSRLNY
jgi:hypothetical protein